MNRRRFTTCALGLLGGLVVLAGCSSGNSGDEASTTLNRSASADAKGADPLSIATQVAGAGYEVYKLINACVRNREIGQPCLASDSTNIRQILKDVGELRKQINLNQKQMLAEFDRIAALLLDQQEAEFKSRLQGLEKNGDLAARAYDALLTCLAAPDGQTKCQAYAGGTGLEPEEPIADAVRRTRRYMMQRVAVLPVSGTYSQPQDLGLVADAFAGTQNGNGEDGLAEAIWEFNKQRQDVALGITDTAIKNSSTVPVVSRTLANEQSQDILYWARAISQWAYLRTVALGLVSEDYPAGSKEATQAEDDSRSFQSTVDREIRDRASRLSVEGAAAYYYLPELTKPGLIALNGSEATVYYQEEFDPILRGREMTPDDVRNLATSLNSYSTATKFASTYGDAIDGNRWYDVKQPIRKASYTDVQVNYYRGSDSCPYADCGFDALQTIPSTDVAWLAGPDATETCVARMRPADRRPAFFLKSTSREFEPAFFKGPNLVQGAESTGAIDPVQKRPTPPMADTKAAESLIFETTYDTHAKGDIEYVWDERFDQKMRDTTTSTGWKRGVVGLGWGGWAKCYTGIGANNAFALPAVPPVMGKAK